MPDVDAHSPDKWYQLSLALGWIVTAIGWFISAMNANRLETRKEIRSELDHILNNLDSLLDSSRTYYTVPDSEHKLRASLEIRALIDRLLGQLDRLDGTIYKKIVPLYEAATGNNFESTAISPQDGVEQYRRVVTHAERLRGEIEIWYAQRYQKNFRSR